MSASVPRIVPVVLSGGSGTRLWPLSRVLEPKQLLSIAEAATMLQATAARAPEQAGFAPLVVVAGETHLAMVNAQLAAVAVAPDVVILEPAGRNTAPAIALAAIRIAAVDPDAMMLVMPSDHVIADLAAFRRAVAVAAVAVADGALAAFGIAADRPETGYGYIEIGSALSAAPGVHHIARFVEKPDLATAQAYLDTGRFAWNGGIFLFGARAYLDALDQYAPEVAVACRLAMAGASVEGNALRPEREAFLAAPSISVDYAIMEKTDRACVVPVEMGWSDVGAWDALWDISEKDADGNVIDGDVVAVSTKGSLLRNAGGPLIATVGVDEVVVVSTSDAVLVTSRKNSQDVKGIVDKLNLIGSMLPRHHRRRSSGWGTIDTIAKSDGFATRRIVIVPRQTRSALATSGGAIHGVVVSGSGELDSRALAVGDTYSLPAGTAASLVAGPSGIEVIETETQQNRR